MSAPFTAGPWKFRLEAVRTVIFHDGDIGERAIAVGAGHYPDHIANARLIAAAPDLYEAATLAIEYDDLLRKYAGPLDVLCEGDVQAIDVAYDKWIAAVRAAYAKARGDA